VDLVATPNEAGKRLDRFLAEQMPELSRARIQEWIRAGRVVVGQSPGRASLRLRGGEAIRVDPLPLKPLKAEAEAIPLDILYEDEDLAAINKPAGLTVHAGAGVTQGTLVNALLHHFGQLSGVGGDLRPGIVHRLDRMTSGVLLVAKHDRAHRGLAAQFQSRKVRKTYWALVHGDAAKPSRQGRSVTVGGVRWTRLEMPISRDPRRRVRMAAMTRGRTAQTDFRVIEHWNGYSLLEVRIATGRTHQIRVHLSAIGHPVAGDRLYGAPAEPVGLPKLDRFFLHAKEIVFQHPGSAAEMRIEAPLPRDFTALLAELKATR
jgi:23S rRNA pseudouridine1911/1915/1917 synthase